MNKAVADVGLFNGTKVSSYSRETHQMLKDEGSLPSQPLNSKKQHFKKAFGNKKPDQKRFKSGLRTHDQIKASEAYKQETYTPPPCTKYGGSYEKDKERLSNIMAFGEDLERTKNNNNNKQKMIQVKKKELDRFDELQYEIEDRKNFMEMMTQLGKKDEFKNKIETEVAQMIKEMEMIDQKRSDELNRMIKKIEK